LVTVHHSLSCAIHPTLDTTNLNVVLRTISQITERPQGVGVAKQVGIIATPEQQGGLQSFDIPVTVTILCFSPSP